MNRNVKSYSVILLHEFILGHVCNLTFDYNK